MLNEKKQAPLKKYDFKRVLEQNFCWRRGNLMFNKGVGYVSKKGNMTIKRWRKNRAG